MIIQSDHYPIDCRMQINIQYLAKIIKNKTISRFSYNRALVSNKTYNFLYQMLRKKENIINLRDRFKLACQLVHLLLLLLNFAIRNTLYEKDIRVFDSFIYYRKVFFTFIFVLQFFSGQVKPTGQ